MLDILWFIIGRAVALLLGLACGVAQYFILVRIVRIVGAGTGTPILLMLLFAAMPVPAFLVVLIFIELNAILWTAGAAGLLLAVLTVSKYRRTKKKGRN